MSTGSGRARWSFPKIRGFEIVRRIGGGGASAVYEAKRGDRHVALKVVELRNEAARARFSRETWIGSMLEHPGVVPSLDAGIAAHLGWISMPLLDGTTLEHAEEDPRFTFEERARVIDRIARAVEHVHARGVLHCDLKPSNVFLTSSGAVKVLDFGAALFEHEGARSAGESFYGTHRYVSPERIAGEPFDRRSDIFSLGVLVFEILTGQHPWDAGSVPALMFAMCSKPPKSFRRAALASSISIPRSMISALSDLVDGALARDTSRRFASMPAFLAAWSSCTSACAASRRVTEPPAA